MVQLAARDRLSEDPPLTLSFIVATTDANIPDLTRLIKSFGEQRRGVAELLLCGPLPRRFGVGEDVRHIEAPGGIAAALAAGVSAARANFVARLDPDGALAPFAVERVARALVAQPGRRLVYTDEIIIDGGRRPSEAVLKPTWDPVMIQGFDYVGRLAIVSTELLREIGGWRSCGAAGDYDLLLRIAATLGPGEALHVPYPAYLAPARPPGDGADARRALAASFAKNAREIPVERGFAINRARPRLDLAPRDWPSVSVVVPSRDALSLIRMVLEGLFRGTDYPDLNVLVIDNGSTDSETLALYADYTEREPRFRLDLTPEPFNFSRAVNRGVAGTRGDLVLLLNNDIEIPNAASPSPHVEDRGWLKEMVACFDYPNTGIVGARLLYPDGTLQHAGVIAGLGGYAGHWFIGRERDQFGPMRRLAVRQSMSVVTGACMLVSRACFVGVGGFDEETFPIAYNDVDFCLRARSLGFRVVWTPFATLVHHESASRGSDETPANIARFERDKAALKQRHATDTIEDPAYNPWFSKAESQPNPMRRKGLPDPR